MSFLSKLFGGGAPLTAIEKSYTQERWADVLTRASSIDECKLTTEEQGRLHDLVVASSDRLSRVNLEEGRACLAAEELQRGIEHLELARELARSPQLREEIAAEMLRIGSRPPADEVPAPVAAKSCSSSCCEVPTASPLPDGEELDEATRFELILTAYPPADRARYYELSPAMRGAILLAHEEEHQQAHAVFSRLPEPERNDIFHFEYGSLLGRLGRYSEAVAHLRTALQKNGSHVLAAATLIDLHLTHKDLDPAEQLVRVLFEAKCMPEYCNARLAFIEQQRGNEDRAFEYGVEALRLGYREAAMSVFVAGVLEKRGRIDDAEAILQGIQTGGGCSGGANLDLAEFWLRHNRKLHQALEMFKKGAKSDAGNPVWGFHIARTYLALGWKKDALPILETLAFSPMVEADLREKAGSLLRNHS